MKNFGDFLKHIVLSPYLVVKDFKKSENWFYLTFLFLIMTVPFLYAFLYFSSAHWSDFYSLATVFVLFVLGCSAFCISLLTGALFGEGIIYNFLTFMVFTLLIFLPLFALIPFLDITAYWVFSSVGNKAPKPVEAILFVVDNILECVLLDIPQIYEIRLSPYKLKSFAGKTITVIMRLTFDLFILGFFIQKIKAFWTQRRKLRLQRTESKWVDV